MSLRPRLIAWIVREETLQGRHALALLNQHQQEIGAALIEAEGALASVEPSRGKALALIRWQLMRLLRNYQLFKHTEIFDPLGNSRDPAVARRARGMKARCIEMGEAYNDHVRRWALQGAGTTWNDYERDARRMIAMLNHHCVREAGEAAILLAGVERTRIG